MDPRPISRKRPFRALGPKCQRGFDSHHPLHLISKTKKRPAGPFVVHGYLAEM